MRHTALVAALALILAVGLPAAGVAGQGHGGHAMVKPDQIQWQEVPSLPSGAKVAVIEGDPAAEGAFTMRISFPPGYTVPLHTHPTVERVTVLAGTFYLGIGDTFERDEAEALPEGSLAVMDAGVAMFGYTGEEPTVIQINGDGPWGIEYLNPEDDPRKQPQ
jgi:quercetin dioxygenase-like cupin family protein